MKKFFKNIDNDILYCFRSECALLKNAMMIINLIWEVVGISRGITKQGDLFASVEVTD